MSILIRNMEMPKSCEECNLESYCSLWVEAKRLCGETFIDAKSKIKATIRHPDCPLIEVKPHGRLIDADVLSQMFDSDESFGAAVLDIIADTPTIIEAEDSFFNSLKRGLEQAINGDVREITTIEVEDDGYFTAEEQKLKWDVIYNKSQKTGININDIIESEGKDDSN